MSQFIKEFGIIDTTIQDKLFTIIKEDNTVFETSQLYSSDEDKKFIDVEKRSSQFRLIIDNKAFDLVDKILEKINKLDTLYNYILFRNNITHINYKTGDFFKVHEDYLSIKSNSIEEYTMIVCMDADCEGGETIFHINDYFKYTSKSSITPYHCLIFRKDLKHEGSLLKSGTKNILTMNIWGIQKSCDTIVGISFAKDKSDNPLLPKYFISTNKIMNTETLLESFLTFSKPTKQITIYNEEVYTEEEFDVIYKLYNKMHITTKEFTDYHNIIDYYQFTINNILIEITDGVNEKIRSTKYTFSDPFIFCATKEHTFPIHDFIKTNRLPYINFKMILAEGSLSYGGEMRGTPTQILNMTPMYIVFSDHNNILLRSTFVTKHTIECDIEKLDKEGGLSEIIRDYDYETDNYCGKVQLCREGDEEEDKNKQNGCKHIDIDSFEATYYFGLELCDLATDDNVFKEIINNNIYRNSVGVYHKPGNKDYTTHQSPYYDIDENNKTVLTPKHYETVINKIIKSKLIDTAKEVVKDIQFVLPQVTHSHSTFFCNEEVYGNANFLTVHGFLRLE